MSDKPLPARPGAGTVQARLAEILRVDHAGELGAVHIYQGQRAVLGAAKGSNPGPLVTHFSVAAGSLPCPLYIIPADYDESANALLA